MAKAAVTEIAGMVASFGFELRLGSWMQFFVGRNLAPFVPMPSPVCRTMLRLARVQPCDKVVDLGCGDARLLIMAVQEFDVRSAVGYEHDVSVAQKAKAAVERAGLDDRVRLAVSDARCADLADADVVCLYLSEKGNQELVPVLSTLPPEARVVSFLWPMPLDPEQETKVGGTSLYLFSGKQFRALGRRNP